ncbi:protection of telomeres protein 1 [Parastagonospora nodorum]|nr:protection of telomeres protein 1 [Parastagonospora nodorum]
MPNGITAISAATEPGAVVSLLGVIVSMKEARRSRGTDWVQEFTIQDDFGSDVMGGQSSITIRIFRPTVEKLPKITGTGDVALLRGFKLNSWNGHVDAVWNRQASSYFIFPSATIPRLELSQPYQAGTLSLPYSDSGTFGAKSPSPHEQMTVIQLKHQASGSAQQVKQFAVKSTLKPTAEDRLSLVKDLEFGKFKDVRAQVVNIYYTNSETVELKVTDYTENKDLYLYVDPDDEDYRFQKQDWKGPYGQYTLNVILYGNNAVFAREQLAVGDYVFLKNLRTKMSPANKLEGALHEDRIRPEQVDIRKLINPLDIAEIKQRRDAYEKTRTKKTAFEQLRNEPTNPSGKAPVNKKAAKRAKQRQQKEQEQKELAEKAEELEAQRSGVNVNIRAAFPEAQLSTISEIIHNPHLHSQTPKYNDFEFPFLNSRHRSRVRVVDFFPPELEMFAHCTSNPAWDKRARNQDPSSRSKWEWGFVLLLEDAKIPPNTVSEKLRVVVGNDSAQYLLNMNAQDLKSNKQLRNKLEEKLFILWGNLLELKTELRDRGSDMPLPPGDNRLQNKSFDACIEEYGLEVRVTEKNPSGYQRMHKLAQTKIMGEI